MIYLDTHIVLWLYDRGAQILTPAARDAINAAAGVLISPMVHLELGYLQEIRRIAQHPDAIVGALHATIGLQICQLPWSAVTEQALGLDWTRDPFDRLIVAHADFAQAALVTHDQAIRERYSRAVW